MEENEEMAYCFNKNNFGFSVKKKKNLLKYRKLFH